MSISGVILAGGMGRRMGGADKGLIEFLGRPMIEHVAERLRPQVGEILINANRELAHYGSLGYPVIEDEIGGFAGPLAGLHKAMLVAAHPYVLTVPCDSPLLPHNLAESLMNGLMERDADLAVAKTGIQSHPVFCLCRTALLPNLEAFLKDGGRKIDAWYSTLEVAEVQFSDNAKAFANVNTPEELVWLEQAA
jgi:molybdopterin-guanine dinucleotide biosynthesis protein A